MCFVPALHTAVASVYGAAALLHLIADSTFSSSKSSDVATPTLTVGSTHWFAQIMDGYCVKYFASCVALLVYAAPIYFKAPSARGTQGQLTSDYIRSMRLLQNTSRGVGDLILVYKRISNLASHTSRVAELLEQVGGRVLLERGIAALSCCSQLVLGEL